MNLNFRSILKSSKSTKKDLINSFSNFIENNNYYEALKIMAFDWEYEVISKKDRKRILKFLEENYDVVNTMSRSNRIDEMDEEVYSIAKFSCLEEGDEFSVDKNMPPVIALVYNNLPKKFSTNKEYFYAGIQEIHPDIISFETFLSVINDAVDFEDKNGEPTGVLRWIVFSKFREYKEHFEMLHKPNKINRDQLKTVLNFCMQDHTILCDTSVFITFYENIDLLCDFIYKNYESIVTVTKDKLFQNAFLYSNKDVVSCMIKKGYKRFSQTIHDLIEGDVSLWEESDFKNEILSLIIKSNPKKFSDKLIHEISSMRKTLEYLLKEKHSCLDVNKTRKKAEEFMGLLNKMCTGGSRIILKP
jgi:hypothetical protein